MMAVESRVGNIMFKIMITDTETKPQMVVLTDDGVPMINAPLFNTVLN